MLTVNSFVALILATVSLGRGEPSGLLFAEIEIEMRAGLGETWLNQLWVFREREDAEFSDINGAGKRENNDLNGARFAIPSSLRVETNAMGRGTIPLIINL